MDAPLALYRRYRPDTFANVIGQDHVTTPLSHALANNRVNHAYLFSGPRGCGKTTSARIMARALNCAQGPTPTPCGVCDSCAELSAGGTGSLDVIEIDAASHGGVDDARDLRERAFFSPMRDRYKVYIIDEAHMVSKEGFNALLKLVEEPPSHLRFIFATTEPDKVIGTIKSRTHHYPFRLVAPKVLSDYVLLLCEREQVTIEPTVLPLIVRAGAGSVRDSLSVLDQLMGGAGPDGVTYALATALLGYTPGSLLDETVDALAADDGATLFGVIEKIIETGQDPRRFAEDLLQRLRDLVVVSVVPDAAARGIIEVPEDQAERFASQAARFGRAELTRAADIVSQGLTDMRGATAPRLLLEIMCARILLPGLDHTAEGFGARLDRMERRLSVVGEPGTAASRPPGVDDGAGDGAGHSGTVGLPITSRLQVQQPYGAGAEQGAGGPPTRPEASPGRSRPDAHPGPSPATPGRTQASPTGAGSAQAASAHAPSKQADPPQRAPSTPVAATASDASSGLTLVDARRLWPGVLDRVKSMRRFSWLLLSQNAQVKDLHDGIITIGFASAGAAKNFRSSGADEILHQALIDELGVDWRVEGIIEGPGESGGGRMPRTAPPGGDSESGSDAWTAADVGAREGAPIGPQGAGDPGPSTPTGTPVPTAGSVAATAAPASTGTPVPSATAPATPPAPDAPAANVPAAAPDSGASAEGPPAGQPEPQGLDRSERPRSQPDVGAAKQAIRPTRVGAASRDRSPDSTVEVADDDDVIDDATLSSHELLARELGAQVIEDVRDDVS